MTEPARSPRRWRTAVIGGCGSWGRYYLHVYAHHPRCEVVALVDRARDRRDLFARHYRIERQYDDVDDLLEHEVPEIASAIVPVGENPRVVTTLAEAGVAVVSCEKPIACALADADRMVDTCRRLGTAFACGTAYWEVPHLLDTVAWVREGHIGPLTAAAIPGGLPVEVSGSGCVQLTMMRALTGMEVEWVEGRALPAREVYRVPEARGPQEMDGPACGRLGLSGGIVCEVPEPPTAAPACRVSAVGQRGRVFLTAPNSVHLVGVGAAETPVFPAFMERPQGNEWEGFFTRVVDRLVAAADRGDGEVACSGQDYRQALEIAVALKLSDARGQTRVELPLADRQARILPHPYRMRGGDVAGWRFQEFGGPDGGPPGLPQR